jgi:hypothetical protein
MDRGRGVLPPDISSHPVPTAEKGLALLSSVGKAHHLMHHPRHPHLPLAPGPLSLAITAHCGQLTLVLSHTLICTMRTPSVTVWS